MQTIIFTTLFTTLLTTLVAAQRYTYTTSTVTECYSTTPATHGPPIPTPTKGGDGYWTVDMPECRDCQCTGCVYTHTYTSTYDIFVVNGVQPMAYSVKEVYRGMSTTPQAATDTTVPYGFTTQVETCTVCGEQALTATMTYPNGGGPYPVTANNIPPGPTTLARVPGQTGGPAQPTSSGVVIFQGAANTQSIGGAMFAVIVPFAMLF